MNVLRKYIYSILFYSTLELSSDPTPEGRLVSQDNGSAGISLPGMWVSFFMLNREKFSNYLFTHRLTFSFSFMVVSQCTTHNLKPTIPPYCYDSSFQALHFLPFASINRVTRVGPDAGLDHQPLYCSR